MKSIKVLLLALFLLPCTFTNAQNNKVTSIDYSDFISDVYPNVKRKPVVLLFGSNYCRNSKNQLKQLRNVVNEKGYDRYIDFYNVNADSDENYDWLMEIYRISGETQKGTPSWAFYFYYNGEIKIHGGAGNLTDSQMCEMFDMIIDNCY